MSRAEIDAYVEALQEPQRSTLSELRQTILSLLPEAEEGLSYRVPAFRVDGRVVAGFAAFRTHLSYLPFSGSVLPQLSAELTGYTRTVSSLHFPADRPLPRALVQRLIEVRRAEISSRGR